ncbi:DEAD-box ATP-dependent RNA helicase 27-like [Nicotiana tomentosiformis]|uniref:DEAD-box ATP-dependent RNA helicase 27-like n=1 Tax=Nicotiana tomentosiformis TaxID=4098 RepID=UPI00388C7B7F
MDGKGASDNEKEVEQKEGDKEQNVEPKAKAKRRRNKKVNKTVRWEDQVVANEEPVESVFVAQTSECDQIQTSPSYQNKGQPPNFSHIKPITTTKNQLKQPTTRKRDAHSTVQKEQKEEVAGEEMSTDEGIDTEEEEEEDTSEEDYESVKENSTSSDGEVEQLL